MNNYYEEKWSALKAEVDKKGGNGEDFVSALKDFYSIYDDEAVVWLAKLYDPEIGGFYYSNSGRDNEYTVVYGEKNYLLPDIESTNQATNFLKGHGVIKEFSDLPEEMREKMYKFVCTLLDPETGFIYHPQWTKEQVDSRPSRRGRDLMWAEDMAKKFDWKYPYQTANDRLANMENDEKSVENIPEYLRTKDKLLEYLNHFDWDNKPYPSGNELAAQVYPIKAAGLSDVAIIFLNSIQNPDTGLWGKTTGYDIINGFFKIVCFYTFSGNAVPNAEKAVQSIVNAMIGDEMPTHVCCQYNCWYSLYMIVKSLRTYGGEEGGKKADEIVSYLLKIAPEALRISKEKVLTFRKPDYSFSYYTDHTSAQSQGLTVAVNGANEGDINATGICSSGIVGNIYSAFELRDFFVPVFSPNAYSKFLENIKT